MSTREADNSTQKLEGSENFSLPRWWREDGEAAQHSGPQKRGWERVDIGVEVK